MMLLQALFGLVFIQTCLLIIVPGTEAEECVEEVLNSASPVVGDSYTTNRTYVTYEGVLHGGELVFPYIESADARSSVLIKVKPSEEEEASYASKTLTEVSFTVEGVRSLIVIVINRWMGAVMMPLYQKVNMTARGQEERVVVNVNHIQDTRYVAIYLERHENDWIKLYDMKLKACKE